MRAASPPFSSGTLLDAAKAMFGNCVDVVKRTEPHRFVVLPQYSETFIAMIHLALHRLI